MPPQQQVYNGLARHAEYSIFAREWTRPYWHSNGLTRTDSVLANGHRSLAYDQHCWHMTSAAGLRRASRCWHGTDIRTDSGTDKVKT